MYIQASTRVVWQQMNVLDNFKQSIVWQSQLDSLLVHEHHKQLFFGTGMRLPLSKLDERERGIIIQHSPLLVTSHSAKQQHCLKSTIAKQTAVDWGCCNQVGGGLGHVPDVQTHRWGERVGWERGREHQCIIHRSAAPTPIVLLDENITVMKILLIVVTSFLTD